MAEKNKIVFVYEQDSKTASYIEFAAHQFDLVTLKAKNVQEASPISGEEAIDIAFINTSLPQIKLAKDVIVVPVLDEGTYRNDLISVNLCSWVLNKPVTVSEIMAIIKSILAPDVFEREDYVFHKLRSNMLLRSLKSLLDIIRNDSKTQFNLSESICQFCVGQCQHAVSGDIREDDGSQKLHLLTVSVQHGKKQCALVDTCKLQQFRKWMQEEHKEIQEEKPQDLLSVDADSTSLEKVQETIEQLLEKHTVDMHTLYNFKKEFCTHHCDVSRNGTDFKEGDVLISEWSDIFCNQCIFCSQPDCALNKFFSLIVYTLKTV